LGNKNFEEKETQKNKTKQNKTKLLLLVNHFVLGNYILFWVMTKKTKPWELYTKSFSLEKLHKKLPDFEGKQKLKVVRF
jgi:hypothetical protein